MLINLIWCELEIFWGFLILLLLLQKRELVMTSAGMFITAIIIGFEIVIFACLIGFPEAGVFYLAKVNLSGQFLSEKILEGE